MEKKETKEVHEGCIGVQLVGGLCFWETFKYYLKSSFIVFVQAIRQVVERFLIGCSRRCRQVLISLPDPASSAPRTISTWNYKITVPPTCQSWGRQYQMLFSLGRRKVFWKRSKKARNSSRPYFCALRAWSTSWKLTRCRTKRRRGSPSWTPSLLPTLTAENRASTLNVRVQPALLFKISPNTSTATASIRQLSISGMKHQRAFRFCQLTIRTRCSLLRSSDSSKTSRLIHPKSALSTWRQRKTVRPKDVTSCANFVRSDSCTGRASWSIWKPNTVRRS